MSVVVAIVGAVSWYGAGRFLRPGDSPPGESVIEGDIFAILNFVLGNGVRHYRVAGRYELRADMMFLVGAREHPLVIEYDGGYWHRDREDTDLRKICETLHLRGLHDIIRLRVHPLRRLRPADISIPRRADAMTCSRLVLLHIAHRPEPYELDDDTLDRIHKFLAFSATELPDDNIHCDFCLELNFVLQEHRSTTSRRMHRLHNPGGISFRKLAAELAQRSEQYEGVWHPDNREWEQAEAAAHQRHGFRGWLQQQRAVAQHVAQSSEVGSTIPLLTKYETGWIEAS